MIAVLLVNELTMTCRPESGHKYPGKVVYEVVHFPFGITDFLHRKVSSGVEFPSAKIIARLGREYLGAEVSSEYNRYFLRITMPTGIKREKRFVFLAALYRKSSFVYD